MSEAVGADHRAEDLTLKKTTVLKKETFKVKKGITTSTAAIKQLT